MEGRRKILYSTAEVPVDILMLRAKPIRLFSNTFSVHDDGRDVARVRIGWFSDNGAVTIDGREMKLSREHTFLGAFEFEHEGVIVARAYKPSVLRNRFEVEIDDRRVHLERESLISRSFVVRCSERLLGRIDPEGMLTRKARIDLPDDWPTELQLFVFWLVLIIWKRMNST